MKTAYNINRTTATVHWFWSRDGELIIEEVVFSDEELKSIREACADDYPFAQYQSDCAEDAEYYDR
jgi:hypothetical protein